MFGSNPVRKQELDLSKGLWIQEIFPTIQGEGPLAGRPAVFVRLGGCNLKCFWCDTDFESSNLRPVTEQVYHIIKKQTTHKLKTDLVVLTGGEPFRQDIRPLVERLLADSYHVQIETNGILWLPDFDRLMNKYTFLDIVCSPKTGKVHPKIEQYASCYKYIVSEEGPNCEEDGLPLASTQVVGKKVRIARPPHEGMPVYVQPLDPRGFVDALVADVQHLNNYKYAANICMKHGYRLSIQGHKIVGLP